MNNPHQSHLLQSLQSIKLWNCVSKVISFHFILVMLLHNGWAAGPPQDKYPFVPAFRHPNNLELQWGLLTRFSMLTFQNLRRNLYFFKRSSALSCWNHNTMETSDKIRHAYISSCHETIWTSKSLDGTLWRWPNFTPRFSQSRAAIFSSQSNSIQVSTR